MISVQKISVKLNRLSSDKLLLVYQFIEFIEQKLRRFRKSEEMDDAEILFAAEQTGSFDFLHEPSEDIYTLEDGEPL
ncbi:MAG TPA: hypothetical protein DCQ37_09380 [Desulfobacteraceae bacterium]|nr:hypothetical protein [Desulfobacteraceae bacterium]